MYYIDDYRKQSIDKIIPYLIQFPQIVKIIENSADRYQAIEDLLWNVANNFRVEDSRGVFLDAHLHNEVVDFIYTDKAEDAFTYGTDKPLYQAYGTGHYYSQTSYISGIKKTASEEKTIRAVLAKIIQNNTSCTVEELIEGLKLFYNASHVGVYESNPLRVSLMLSGDNLELSSSGNYENIKKMLPACVSLNNIYVNPYTYDLFTYSKTSSYGDNRYPVRVGETVDKYNYISHSVTLNSVDNEYIQTNKILETGTFCCITGSFSDLKENNTLISANDGTNSFSVKVVNNDQLNKCLALTYNDIAKIDEIDILNINDRYTIILYNDGENLKAWFKKSTNLTANLETDSTFIRKQIYTTTPSVIISGVTDVNAPIYINCENNQNVNINFGDFTYYATLFGETDADTQELALTEYYASCFGEKQILFNCLENKNHLQINTNNELLTRITTKQSYFNYKDKYSNGKYAYFDGKSYIQYTPLNNNIECEINSFDISFDLCTPTEIKEGYILHGLIGTGDETMRVYLNNNGGIVLQVSEVVTDSEGETIIVPTTYSTPDNTLILNEYANIGIKKEGNNIIFYKNNIEIRKIPTTGMIYNINNNYIIGSNNDNTSFFNGFIKNINLNIFYSIENEDYYLYNIIPLEYTLKDITETIHYNNSGVRFITTPQLINDTTNLDLYGNALIGVR